MLGFAGRALSHVPAAALHRSLATYAAELVASMPVELCPALRQDAGFAGAELSGRGAGLFKPPRFIQVQLMSWVAELGDIDGEMRHALREPQEHRRHIDLKTGNLGGMQPSKMWLRIGTDQHIKLPERQETALG